jgi:hypothetical protein
MKHTQLSKMAITLLIGSILTSVTLQAGWIKGATYAYNVLDGFGTWSFYSELLENEIFKPNRADAKLRARPDLYTYEKTTTSGAYHGKALEESEAGAFGQTHNVHNYAGNYAEYIIHWIIVEYDEEDEEHYVVNGAGGASNGPHWWSKSIWESFVDSPAAAKESSWWEAMMTGDNWSRTGFWITIGSSVKLEYPDVTIKSDVWNPAPFGTVLDGQLVNTAKNFGGTGLNYTAKVHFELQKLTWISGPNGTGYWTNTDWKTNIADKFTHVFPGYQDSSTTKSLCPQNHRIRREEVKGGMDIWWNQNISYSNATVETQELDEQGNRTGPIETQTGYIQKNIDYVIDFSTESPD